MENLSVFSGTATNATLQLVGFKVGSEEFGVDILKVQEIIRMVPISPIPNAPDFVDGIINLRGRIIPVVDFRKRFRMSEQTESGEKSRRIVVFALVSETVGIVVDSVTQVMKLKDDQISPPPRIAAGLDGDAIVGVGQLGEKILTLLDLERVFQENTLH